MTIQFLDHMEMVNDHDRVRKCFLTDGATTLIGYELGRKNFDFVEREVNYFFGLTAFMSVLTIVFLLVFAPGIASLFAIASQESFNLAVSIIQVLSLRVAFRLFNVIIFACYHTTRYLIVRNVKIKIGFGTFWICFIKNF